MANLVGVDVVTPITSAIIQVKSAGKDCTRVYDTFPIVIRLYFLLYEPS